MPRFSEIRCRCVTVDGPTARRLREERGLTIEQLAIEAGCSDKTIQALEMGKPKLKSIVKTVAKALGEDPDELKPTPHVVVVPPAAPAPASGPPPDPSRLRRLVVVWELPPKLLENAPEELHFVLKLAENAGTSDPIVVLNAAPGSIRLTLEVSHEDALRIVDALMAGKLKDLGIQSVSIQSPPTEWGPEEWSEIVREMKASYREDKALELKQRWRAAQANDLRPDLPQRCRLVLVYQFFPGVLESAPADLPFLGKFSKDAGTSDPIVVLHTEPGSSRLTLEVSPEDALRIVDALREGKLSAHSLRAVALFDTEDAVEAVSSYPAGTWDFSIAQSQNEIVVTAQLPGHHVSRITLTLSEDDALKIEATVRLKSDDAGQLGVSDYQWCGRMAVLPCNLDYKSESFQKYYANGILELRIQTIKPPAEDDIASLRHRMVEVQMPDMPTDTEPEE